MKFRYFDAAGKQLTGEQLKSMRIVTPAMEHVFSTVAERVEKSWKEAENLENCASKQYH